MNPVDLVDCGSPALLGRFLDIIGSEPWQKRHRVLSDEMRLNPISRNLIIRRHAVELTLGRLLETHNTGAPLSFALTEAADYAALGFVADRRENLPGVVRPH